MKTLYTLLFLFSCFSFSASAQTVSAMADTAIGNRLLKESNELNNRRQYDSAYAKADKGRFSKRQNFNPEHSGVFWLEIAPDYQ